MKLLIIEGEPSTADCSGMELEAIKELPSSLRRLDVSDNALSNSNLDFSSAKSLTFLDLKSNKLTSLSGLETLKTIQVLNLGANKIASIANVATFGANLKALILNNNFLTTLPDLSPLTNLNTLVLSHNNLTALPRPFPRLPQLKKLSVTNNQLSEYPVFTVPPPPLQELRLSHNQIKNLPTKNPKAASTYTIPTLKTLDLGSNSLDSLDNLKIGLLVLAPPNSIVNLNLKANPVAEVASSDSDTASYKHVVISVAGSNLKVLDGVRFDAKFLERKEKRKESGWLQKRQEEDEEDANTGAADLVPSKKDVKNHEKLHSVSKKTTPALKDSKKAALAAAIVKKPFVKTPVSSRNEAKSGSQRDQSAASAQKNSVTKKSASVPTNSSQIVVNPLKRKADTSVSDKPVVKKVSKPETDTFFKESFKPKAVSVTSAATSSSAKTQAPVAKVVDQKVEASVKRVEKQLDKHEEKLRSGVVGVVEVKPTHKKIGGAKVLVKPVNIEELEKGPGLGKNTFGTGLAAGWD
ncbi:L domain-like protein [Rhizoclosmatium globosum]|uniref:L domain-like protein n=1 Tax=Rhizoclosmatium globosum TaxID=329046 RepID=A0A1Y2CZI4_9FUNG|nr:L domain-like protein [Rhizoclosmatium globosum]|eukprot:ORY52443.1 L domain-like protein [Rhizoclosmatium globosum]